ncbi:Replication factor A [Candidatus Anstonella stagnisolia]|nr:Replication factor A [Candidatus Anstonella stagnisolia]
MASEKAEKYYAELCAQLGKEKLEGEVQEKIGAYFGLLTREAALCLIAKKMGIAKEEQVVLSGIRQWMKRVCTAGRIARVFPMQEYEKNGIVKKSVRVVLEDESGQCTLVLWNANAARLFGEIGVGDAVRVWNAYMTREGELSLGAEGKMERLKAAPLGKIGHLKEGVHNIEGVVKEIFLDYPYMKNGKESRMCSFSLAQGGKEARVVVWANPQRVNELEIGEQIRIENALYKNNELQLGEFARIVGLSRKENGWSEGQVEKLEILGEGIVAQIGGKEIVFGKELAPAALGLKFLPDGVSLATAFRLKGKEEIGKIMGVRAQEEGGKLHAKAIERK